TPSSRRRHGAVVRAGLVADLVVRAGEPAVPVRPHCLRSRAAAWASSRKVAVLPQRLPASRAARANCTSKPKAQGAMAIRSFFPTRIYTAALPSTKAAALNARLLRECLQLSHDDRAGQAWSRNSYPGGFTSYASASRMHRVSPTFDALRRALDRHVKRFVTELEFDLGEARLTMTDCWVNVMPP